jgi:hypothetical protein
MAAHNMVSTRTPNYTITIVEGALTIEGKGKALSPDETERLLEILLIWRYGLEELPPDNPEE